MVLNTMGLLFMILNNQTKFPDWKECRIFMANPKSIIERVVKYNIHTLKKAVVKKVEQIIK